MEQETVTAPLDSVRTYRNLDSDKIVQTIQVLQNRISERFGNSGLSKVAAELLQISLIAVERSQSIRRPNLPLRVAVGFLILTIIATLVTTVVSVRVGSLFSSYSDFLQGVEAGFNVIILTGAGIFFLVSLEIRLKRTKALKMLHELRVLAHLVDMHQLTKDPEQLFSDEYHTQSSPVRKMSAFELWRYLDYCGEMLSLIGKIAALYAQYFDDHVVLEAVDQVEDLSTSLSRKIWQKIMIIDKAGLLQNAKKSGHAI